jgi:hypothetical protein
MRQPAHLFVDISAHGFGHLAQAAPVLNALSKRLPELRLTIRSGLPTDKLQARVTADFTHLQERSDFGYVMHDAVSLDLEATGSPIAVSMPTGTAWSIVTPASSASCSPIWCSATSPTCRWPVPHAPASRRCRCAR